MVDHRVTLAARHAVGSQSGIGVACNPHPQMGGTMDNNVVLAVCDALGRIGLGSLRFDFRGAGGSTGHYADGVGEVDDLIAVLDRAWELTAGGPVHLVGYSFGAWIAVKALRDASRAHSLTLIAPPLDFLDFSDLRLPDLETLVMVGLRDAYGSPASVDRWLGGQERRVRVEHLPGADHFFVGHEHHLERRIAEFLR
jgi:alpha/beta superfamily hydrolase